MQFVALILKIPWTWGRGAGRNMGPASRTCPSSRTRGQFIFCRPIWFSVPLLFFLLVWGRLWDTQAVPFYISRIPSIFCIVSKIQQLEHWAVNLSFRLLCKLLGANLCPNWVKSKVTLHLGPALSICPLVFQRVIQPRPKFRCIAEHPLLYPGEDLNCRNKKGLSTLQGTSHWNFVCEFPEKSAQQPSVFFLISCPGVSHKNWIQKQTRDLFESFKMAFL